MTTAPHPPAFEIRVARVGDAPEISRLLAELRHPTSAESIASRWAAWSAEGNSALAAACPDGTLLGVATLHRTIVLHRPRPVGRITVLVVDERYRGRGIGRALVAAAESALAAAGCGLLEITSNLRLVEAHAFYEHLGYARSSFRFVKELA
ncbi:Aminoglycoside N(6')-acetyltransferase type 1 [Aquisphaera giovannonii]|uniref:Aminoglycoside N(6')-acetyltransferase type 1 n=1 Tax=Aquisphaera giovannonii TaxID=406548 RepID=A0A5B9W5N7_9BACT|nr:GNAT family N-acetyltransferase [Aquisphaera giovannonii]QEH35986.1 Aminoglycoside N(6')-acetyltransferase type 1 [Aquisphaera giovannonii]